MSSDIDHAIAQLQAKFDGADFSGTCKFVIQDQGSIRVEDGKVAVGDGDADVTISATMDTFQSMFDGDLSPTVAYMTGKMKIDGDMGRAMKLSAILA